MLTTVVHNDSSGHPYQLNDCDHTYYIQLSPYISIYYKNSDINN